MKCEHCRYNTEIVDRLKNEVPSEAFLGQLTDVFKVFGDTTRIKIMWNLFDNEICVADIAEKTGMSQSAISHQLRLLKQARLIKARRDGKNTFYSLNDEHVKRIIEQVMIHISEK
ncbi:MAG: metalloregulator ArsR/SmtB family transcription factor [Clostridiales bacterium]|nr:metalloregulator ArsR/SmtB family transcription factor [Clostridiales bacterium]